MFLRLLPFSLFALLSTSYGATTVTENFSDGTVAPFSNLDNTNSTVNADGQLEFENTASGQGSDQGSGVQINVSPVSVVAGTPLYFQFASRYSGRESDYFFGNGPSQPQSSSARSSDATGFSLGITNDGNVIARAKGAEVAFTGAAFQSLATNTPIFFDIVVNPVSVNGNQISFTYDVTANILDSSGDVVATSSLTGIEANQNPQSQTAVDNYTFNAIGTRGEGGPVSYVLDDFVVSDMPIPEPGSVLLLISSLGFAGVLRRRRA